MQFRLHTNNAQFLQWLPTYWGNYFKILTLASRLYLFWLLSLWLSCIHSSLLNYGQAHFPVFSLKISSCCLSRDSQFISQGILPHLVQGSEALSHLQENFPDDQILSFILACGFFPQDNYLIRSSNYVFSSWLIYGLFLSQQ